MKVLEFLYTGNASGLGSERKGSFRRVGIALSIEPLERGIDGEIYEHLYFLHEDIECVADGE